MQSKPTPSGVDRFSASLNASALSWASGLGKLTTTPTRSSRAGVSCLACFQKQLFAMWMWRMYWISLHTLIDSRLCVVPENPTSNESRVSLLRRQGSTWRPWWSSQSLRRITATSHLSPIYRLCQHGSTSAPQVPSVKLILESLCSLYNIFIMGWGEIAVSKFGLVQTPKMSVDLINQWVLS